MTAGLDQWWAGLLLPLFVGLWCGVCLLLAKFGGWSALATRFPASDKPSGENFSLASVKIGVSRYNWVISAVKGDAGLYLSVLALWRCGHRPLLIPWSEMKNARRTKILWSEWVDCEIAATSVISIRLPLKFCRGKIPGF